MKMGMYVYVSKASILLCLRSGRPSDEIGVCAHSTHVADRCSRSNIALRSAHDGDCSLNRYQHLAAKTPLVHMSLPFVAPGSDLAIACTHSASTFPSSRVQLSLMSSGVPSLIPRYLSLCLSLSMPILYHLPGVITSFIGGVVYLAWPSRMPTHLS